MRCLPPADVDGTPPSHDGPMTTRQSQSGSDRPVRASDAERDDSARRIQVATAQGRLTLQEAEERLDSVFGSRFRHELSTLLVDLPDTEPHGLRRRRSRCRRPFDTRWLRPTRPWTELAGKSCSRHPRRHRGGAVGVPGGSLGNRCRTARPRGGGFRRARWRIRHGLLLADVSDVLAIPEPWRAHSPPDPPRLNRPRTDQ